MGAAEAAANLLWELRIAEKNEAIHIKNKKGKVILVKSIATSILSISSTNPGAMIDTNPGIKIWIKRTKKNKIKNRRLKTLFAKLLASFFPFKIAAE